MGHAYDHLVGTVIGVKVGEFESGQPMIAAATITRPETGQNDNLVMIHIHGEEFNYNNVRYMNTYRADYVNVRRDWVRITDVRN